MILDALATAVALATPASVYAAVRKDPQERFLWIALRDKDSYLSIDTWENDLAYLLSGKQPLQDGEYKLSDGRIAEIKAGRVKVK
jgi:hypothetical protein